MNKKQLASKIWNAANNMRSKIEAYEYKDYILGFIFYKYLSEKEEEYLLDARCLEEQWKDYVIEDDEETVNLLKNHRGYFIPYKYLFSTWIKEGVDVATVRDALSSFSRHISDAYKELYDGVFEVLHAGLGKLGDTDLAQSKAIRSLIKLINDIPMNGKQDYDVLGFIYEYLISQFAANAGKKAGEFYTPHEVSLLMSEIVAHHLRDRESISIYDPTSGSGSLLLNIGRSMSRYIPANRILYYAQELKANTFNLTRMNLVMRCIESANITVRNADTLESDWPRSGDNAENPLWVDSVVSNPPYSQNWNPSGKDVDPRYVDFGLAPKSKADYAFLLHDLHHLKSDGIMCIVLPHGVLFRGGEEAEIRRKLIEKGHIHAVIGLPANIFFGTGIPTIIMVLRQSRSESDVLVVDASKGFVKEGKNNRLRARDIRKIVDVVTQRVEIPKFSRLVSLTEIQKNEYNLNIPRYVDSSEPSESWDIYASMFGGIPASEVDLLSDYWNAFSGLRDALFRLDENGYYSLQVKDVRSIIQGHPSVAEFRKSFSQAFAGVPDLLNEHVVAKICSLSKDTKKQEFNVAETEAALRENIFHRAAAFSIVDKYDVFQIFNDAWLEIASDLEMMTTEGFAVTTRQVDEKVVIKKKEGKDVEVRDGWVGHIMPFSLVEKHFLSADSGEVVRLESEIEALDNELADIIDGLDEDNKEKLLNNSNDAFVANNIKSKLKDLYEEATSSVIAALMDYLNCPKKQKLSYVNCHPEVEWSQMPVDKDGLYANKVVSQYIKQLKTDVLTKSESAPIVRASLILENLPKQKKQIKEQKEELHKKTKSFIESMTDEQIVYLLKKKWISPIVQSVSAIPNTIVDILTSEVKKLAEKYSVTFTDIETDIDSTARQLVSMLDMLVGSDTDVAGIQELKKILSDK